jgi:hypothetical protein
VIGRRAVRRSGGQIDVGMAVAILGILGIAIQVWIVTVALTASFLALARLLLVLLALCRLTPLLLGLLLRAGDGRRGDNRWNVWPMRNDRMNRVHGELRVVISEIRTLSAGER